MQNTHTNAETNAVKAIRMTSKEFAEADFTFNDIFSGDASKINKALAEYREKVRAMRESGEQVFVGSIR